MASRAFRFNDRISTCALRQPLNLHAYCGFNLPRMREPNALKLN
jgi:hypothetical protein